MPAQQRRRTLSVRWDHIKINYMFEFEPVIADRAARARFAYYLAKEEYNAEPLVFIRVVERFREYISEQTIFTSSLNFSDEEYKQELASVFEQISEMIKSTTNNFLRKNSEKELNLPHELQTQVIQQVETLLHTMEVALQAHLNPQLSTPILSLPELQTQIRTVFSKVELYIRFQLKYDSFSRFVRTNMWRNYVCKLPEEELEKLGKDPRSHNTKITTLTAHDLVDPVITDRFINYIKLQSCEDSNHWHLGYNGSKGNCTFYSTTKNFFTGDRKTLIPELQNMLLTKCVYYFEATVKEVILMCIGKETHFDKDPNVLHSEKVEYVPISETNRYASQICAHNMTMGSLFKKRFATFSWTMLYDEEQDQYIIVAKTCDHEQAQLPANHIKSYIILGCVIKKLSDSKTRLVMFQQLNHGGIFKSKIFKGVAILLLKQRAKRKYKDYCKLLKDLGKKEQHCQGNEGWSVLEQEVTSTFGILDTFKENTRTHLIALDEQMQDLKHTNFSMRD